MSLVVALLYFEHYMQLENRLPSKNGFSNACINNIIPILVHQGFISSKRHQFGNRNSEEFESWTEKIDRKNKTKIIYTYKYIPFTIDTLIWVDIAMKYSP